MRLKRGDRTAMTPVYTTLWPVLRRFAGRWLSGSPVADDVAQQALLKVFEQAPAFDEQRDALAWAVELTAWECRTERQRHRRAREGAWEAGAEPVASGASPAEVFEAAELQAALDAAVITLAPEDQAALRALLDEARAGAPRERKRRQRAVERLTQAWRRLHGA